MWTSAGEEIGRQRAVLRTLFDAAVHAAQPAGCLPAHLPEPPATGRLILLGGGKGAGSMTAFAEAWYADRHGLGPDRLVGLAVTRLGYGVPTRWIEVVEAGHPVPDATGVAATKRTLEIAGAQAASACAGANQGKRNGCGSARSHSRPTAKTAAANACPHGPNRRAAVVRPPKTAA